MKVKVGYAKNLRVWSGWVGYGLVFGQHIFKQAQYSEETEYIHWVSFLDGAYFKKFIFPNSNASKIRKQKDDIEKSLNDNPQNFFVNTAGLTAIIPDLRGI